jgi:hypothetical protein
MVERRKQQRWPAYWAGRIIFKRSGTATECLVRNTSSGGAKLVLRGAIFVPPEFELNIPKHGADYHATVVWRRSDEIGVTFKRIDRVEAPTVAPAGVQPSKLKQAVRAPPPPEPRTPMALLRQLKKLRQQNALLRRRLLLQSEPTRAPFDSPDPDSPEEES